MKVMKGPLYFDVHTKGECLLPRASGGLITSAVYECPRNALLALLFVRTSFQSRIVKQRELMCAGDTETTSKGTEVLSAMEQMQKTSARKGCF